MFILLHKHVFSCFTLIFLLFLSVCIYIYVYILYTTVFDTFMFNLTYLNYKNVVEWQVINVLILRIVGDLSDFINILQRLSTHLFLVVLKSLKCVFTFILSVTYYS